MTDYTGRGGYYENKEEIEEELCSKHNIKPAIEGLNGKWKCPICELEDRVKALELRFAGKFKEMLDIYEKNNG